MTGWEEGATIDRSNPLGELLAVAASYAACSSGEAEALKACCASIYGVDLVAAFLGESYHPGGLALTRTLADALALRPGQRVLDVASGIGTTAMLLAREYGVEVLGIDLGEAQVARARARAKQAGLEHRVRFEAGDAERLDALTATYDAVVCECSLCVFPAKSVAAAEFARVVVPGGRVGISDVWITPDRLDAQLAGVAGRVGCLADARPIAEVRTILSSAGLQILRVERHDEALTEMIEQVETRLRSLKLVDLPLLRMVDFDRAVSVARTARAAVAAGDMGYALFIARRPEDVGGGEQ